MRENRLGIARTNAGLSIGQAAKLLGVERDAVELAEKSTDLPSACAKCGHSYLEHEGKFGCTVPGCVCCSALDLGRCAEIYGVNLEWMLGTVDRYDYTRVDAMRGAEVLTPHDRDVLAEFAASLRRTKPKTLDDIRRERGDS